MIDLDAIEKECQQMVADGLGFIAPKSCCSADMVAELVEAVKDCRRDIECMSEVLGGLESNCAGSTRNRRVMKTGGSFQHTGVVVSEFKTTLGQSRIVVEFDDPVSGMLHIYRPDQVENLCEQEEKCEQ